MASKLFPEFVSCKIQMKKNQNNAEAKSDINNVEKSIGNYFFKMIEKPHNAHMDN